MSTPEVRLLTIPVGRRVEPGDSVRIPLEIEAVVDGSVGGQAGADLYRRMLAAVEFSSVELDLSNPNVPVIHYYARAKETSREPRKGGMYDRSRNQGGMHY